MTAFHGLFLILKVNSWFMSSIRLFSATDLTVFISRDSDKNPFYVEL
jgi:hypothetical protein